MGKSTGDSPLLRFKKIGNSSWQKTIRSFTADIVYLGLVTEPYQITINPGAIVSTHNTLRNAKNHFRKFLHDKPPI